MSAATETFETVSPSRSDTLLTARYGLAQALRIAWYTGHYAAARHVSGPAGRPGEAPPAYRGAPVDRRALFEAFRDLFARDMQNVADGVYPMPDEVRGRVRPSRLARMSRAFLADSARVARRKQARGHSEVMGAHNSGAYPRYYLQNFHFQTDGWLSEDSAKLYDMQVETLFTGAAGAMRRQALRPLRETLGAKTRGGRLLDVATGAGAFVRDMKDAFPALNIDACDLSAEYLAEASRRLRGRRDVRFFKANAEALPSSDASYDAVTAVYLFHELPPKARAVVATEIARVLKPGGAFVLVDTLQYGDDPRFDRLVEAFPREFHEPYYDGYCRESLADRFGPCGLVLVDEAYAFLSKVSVFRKT